MDMMGQLILFLVVITGLFMVFCFLTEKESEPEPPTKKRQLPTKEKKLKSKSSFYSPDLSPFIYHQDTAEQGQRKRIQKVFEDQAQTMRAMATKPHSAECEDSFTCTKSPCFVFEPDKIVGKEEVVNRLTNEERALEIAHKDKVSIKAMTRLRYGLEKDNERNK